jgi:hypothetical protein
MLEMFLRANGFKRNGDTWTRQNLRSNGLFDLDISPDGDKYVCVLRKSNGERAQATRSTYGVIDLVTTFLLS